ncbi:hypothetical protein COOONC_16030 [Cooperia oncophora]
MEGIVYFSDLIRTQFQGFMSKMLLIDPDWQHKDKELPSRFVVKILTQLVMQKMGAEMNEIHNIETTFGDPKFMEQFEAMAKRVSLTKL